VREIGLEVLDIFEEKLVAKEQQVSHTFNGNNKYIYLPDDAEIIPVSPFYGFTLIPDITKKGVDSTPNIIYLLQFVNWSIYFYNELKSSYDAIESYPLKEVLCSEVETSNILADMIFQLSTEEEKVEATTEQIKTDAKNRLSKNHAILKPTKFLQLCRFFARAWFDENFGVEGSIKFAHYIDCYIKNNPSQTTEPKCTYYKANSRNKEEVDALFRDKEQKLLLQMLMIHFAETTYAWTIIHPKLSLLKHKSILKQHEQTLHPYRHYINTNISFQLMNFTIYLTKTYNTLLKRLQKLSWSTSDVNLTMKDFQYHWKHFSCSIHIDEMAIYTISVDQRGSEYIFYKYARLHIARYDRPNFYTKVAKKR